MEKQKIAILGSTGSIGTQALDIVRQHSNKFEIVLLSANSNVHKLIKQVQEFKPTHAVICDETCYEKLKTNTLPETKIYLAMIS